MRHLRRADPVMRRLIDVHGPLSLADRRRGRPRDAYGALLRSIVGQQLSTKAARAIYERLTELFGGRAPAPSELLATDPERIRAVGMSRRKVEYLRDLAGRVEGGSLPLDRLRELPDEQVAAELTRVKGLGPWTADMFLIFHLERPDVLAVGDPRHARRGEARVLARRAADGCRADPHRRAVAAVSLARLPLPVALARRGAGDLARAATRPLPARERLLASARMFRSRAPAR